MLNLRDGLFTVGRVKDVNLQTVDSTFRGITLGTHCENDGVYFSRKVMILSVATNPAADETIAVGGCTYTFKVAPTASTHIKIGAIGYNMDFANADDGYWSGKHWTIDATGALHVAGPASGTISAFSDYRGTVGGAVLVTDGSHGLATGDVITITGTTNYDGTYTITKVDSDTFYITGTPKSWQGDDATGSWTSTSYTEALFQDLKEVPVVAGYTYTVAFTVSGITAGTVTPYIGGTAGTTRSTNNTFTENIVATNTDSIKLVPSTDFDGKITSVVITESHTDYKGLTALAIRDRINIDTDTSLCKAYTGYSNIGLTSEVLIVANTYGSTPTFTADGVKVVAAVAFGYSLTEAQLETVAYFKKDITAEADVKPISLTERNAGTDKNYLY